jgi:diguanylate cyclase (GGDEF)-like protein/PAS domain S-box-containing protein
MPRVVHRCLLVHNQDSKIKLIAHLADMDCLKIYWEDRYESGLKEAGAHSYDVILLDLDLHKPDSREIFNKFFSLAHKTPIIIMSESAEPDNIQPFIKAGAQDFLRKGYVSGEQITQSISFAIERKQCELKLRESYRMVANFTYDWEYWENPDGTIRYVSPACERVTGYSQQEFMDLPDLYKEIVISEDREKFARFYNRDIREKGPRKCYFRIRRKNSDIRWIEHTSQHAFDENGIYLGIRVSNRDMTDLIKADEDLGKSEQKFQRLIEAANDAVIISDVETGVITNANPRAAAVTGRSVDELIGLPVYAIHPPGEKKFYQEFFQGRVYNLPHPQRDLFIQHQDGRKIPVEISSSVTGFKGKTIMLDIFRDISERRQTQERLRKLSLAVEQSPASVMITDPGGYIEYVNPRFTQTTGYGADEACGKNFRSFKAAEVDQRRYDDMWSSARAGREWRGEFYNARKDGTRYWESISVSPITLPNGKITHFLFAGEDITLRKDYEKQLLRQANYDSLTGLPNRVLLLDRLNQALERVRREKVSASVLFIDLDRFKDVNDSLGHEIGDRLLVEAAGRLKACVRTSDTVARLGGDEFVVLLPSTSQDVDASFVAERILESFTRTFQVDDQEIYITASIGISVAPNDSLDPQVLLKNADAAMYKSKDLSRNTYHFFTPAMEEAAHKRTQIKASLRHALEDHNFFMVYQPLLDVTSARIVGAEALIRWQDPRLGMVFPDQFLPMAEETHLIGPIGAWVLEESLRQARIWQCKWDPEFCIAVNISVQQINDPHFARDFETALKNSRVAPGTVTLEIVEHFILNATGVTMDNINRLHSLGVNLAVDDFGVGYSALGYFSKIPFDIMKVDRQFLQDIPFDPVKADLYRAIMNVGQILKLKVVSEGVETEEQFNYIRQLGADCCQGYFFSRPVAPGEFEAYYQVHAGKHL